MSYSKDKKGGQGQDKRGSQEVNAYGGEGENEAVEVSEVTSRWGFGQEHYSFKRQ